MDYYFRHHDQERRNYGDPVPVLEDNIPEGDPAIIPVRGDPEFFQAIPHRLVMRGVGPPGITSRDRGWTPYSSIRDLSELTINPTQPPD